MATPLQTRLRYVKGNDPDQLTAFLGRLRYRVQIYSIAHDGSAWFVWYVPPDDLPDGEIMGSVDLEDL